jgi:hypothetical protein
MKHHLNRIGFLAVFAMLALFATVAQPQDAKSTGDLQVLFIGNSFTYYHDLPKMISELAKAGKQLPMRYERETPGGCTLEKHWKDGKALKKIQSRKWDFVVLQDQSQAPLLKQESMFEHGKKFDPEIKKQGARTILYMTWASQNKPNTQSAITKAYQDLGKELNSQLAPVGSAWELALGSDKMLVLHEKDQLHPNKTGTYLAACVFYATVYGKSPEGLPGQIGGLTDDQARPLQVIAWKAVQTQK